MKIFGPPQKKELKLQGIFCYHSNIISFLSLPLSISLLFHLVFFYEIGIPLHLPTLYFDFLLIVKELVKDFAFLSRKDAALNSGKLGDAKNQSQFWLCCGFLVLHKMCHVWLYLEQPWISYVLKLPQSMESLIFVWCSAGD